MGADDELGTEEGSKKGNLVGSALGVKRIGRAAGASVGGAVGVLAYKVTTTFPSPPFSCPIFLLRDPIPEPLM